MANSHTFKIRWPVDDNEIEIRVEYDYYKYLQIYWPDDFMNLITAYEVLQNPNRIFADLRRPHSNSSNKLCIVGKPHVWYVGETPVSFPKDLVYLVFLNERKSLYEFRAEKSDIEDTLSPERWKIRFGKLIWKKPS